MTKRATVGASSAEATEAYLQALPADQRAALEKLRAQILAAAPTAEAHFGYGLPGFTLRGHPFIYFGAATSHCALYGSNDESITAKLGGYKHSKGAIQFTPERPLPATLVKEIVKTRAAANLAKWGEPAAKKVTRTVTKKVTKDATAPASREAATPKTKAVSKTPKRRSPARKNEPLDRP